MAKGWFEHVTGGRNAPGDNAPGDGRTAGENENENDKGKGSETAAENVPGGRGNAEGTEGSAGSDGSAGSGETFATEGTSESAASAETGDTTKTGESGKVTPAVIETYQAMYGAPVSFIGSPWADLNDLDTFASADVVVVGAPFDGGTSSRPGARFGPRAIRATDYLAHDGPRPHLALGVDVKQDLRIVDAGDVVMLPGEIESALGRLEAAVAAVARSGAIPVVLGGDHSIALPDVTGVARHLGFGRVSVVHFDAHADTGELAHGSLLGHGTPMRRLIESGAARGDRFLQIGLRGYWPGPDVLTWMADQGMRSYEMTEVVRRGLDACLDEAFEIATRDCDGVFLSIDVDVVDPGMAPGTGTPEPGGLTSRQLLDAVRRCALELPLAGIDVVEVSPPYDGPGEITAFLANRVVLEALSGMARRRKDAAGSTLP